jgi:double-stranded uracil-DNA glycosylase
LRAQRSNHAPERYVDRFAALAMTAAIVPDATPGFILPDLLQPGLRLVFCGTAAGTVSAMRGHYYAHPQNKFWRTLHDVGFTPRLLAPGEYAALLEWRIGLTDLAKHAFGMDRELPRGSLGADAVADLSLRIGAARPRVLAFTSLTAGRRFLKRDAGFGEQRETIGATRIWLLPSPSPTAGWNWDANKDVWRALAKRVGSL